MKCEICERDFMNYISLGIHIVCGHKINTKEYYDIYLKKGGEGICYCGKETNFYRLKTGYLKYCSNKCVQNSKEVKEKKIQTCLERYGVKSTNQLESTKDKSKQTMLERYGVEHALQSKELQKKKTQTMLKNHGVKHALQVPEFIKSLKEKVSGPNHHAWIEDRKQRFSPYTERFHDENFRNQIRNEQDNVDPIIREPLNESASLHHIDYDKQNDSRENLIFLNRSSHGKTNYNRKYWQKKLKEINMEII